MKKLNYTGPISRRQLRTLFTALGNFEVNELVTIRNVNQKQPFHLRDIVTSLEHDIFTSLMNNGSSAVEKESVVQMDIDV